MKYYSYDEVDLFPFHSNRYKRITKKSNKFDIERNLKRVGKIKAILILSLVSIIVISALVLVFSVLESLSKPDVEDAINDDMAVEAVLKVEDNYMLDVSTDSPLPSDYTPAIVDFENIKINAIIEEPLTQMLKDAAADSIDLSFDFGFVSATQQDLMHQSKIEQLINQDGYTKIMANAKASDYVPPGGSSENQMGFTITLDADPETFEDSETYLWLKKNMADYGFIFRYPPDKAKYTENDGNLLVIRYVDSDNAIAMRQLNMCFEEYLSYID